MTRISRTPWAVLTVVVVTAMMIAACGGADSTPTTVAPTATTVPTPIPATPTPTAPVATPRATATVAAATPAASPTTVAPTPAAPTPVPPATAAPTAVPTPTPSGAVPTPVVPPDGKRGGILNTSILTSYIDRFDTFSAGGKSAIPVNNMLLNNLLWTDPYGKEPGIKVGDMATGWEFSAGGTVLTFRLQAGVKFHDGNPLTSKDVAYNIDRARTPRSPTMTEFQGRLDAIASIETPDDRTVRLILSRPSAYILEGLALSQFLIYPAHMPLPQSNDDWKAKRIGSGPFKVGRVVPAVRVENIRNDSYWKPGRPYLDGVTLFVVDDPALVVASYRTGKLDANSIDSTALQDVIDDKTLEKAVGWTNYIFIGGAHGLYFNQKAPWTDPRVREAVDLAINRQEVVKIAYLGKGYPYATLLMPPAMGGRWGLPESEMVDRPGFRADKTQDLARAKQLLAEAGVDPSKVTMRWVGGNAGPNPALVQVVDSNLRGLGFKVNTFTAGTVEWEDARRRGDFDLVSESLNIQSDDPSDYLAGYVRTGGGFNYSKWSNPAIDKMLDEQDQSTDVAKRRQLLRELQLFLMKDRTMLIAGWNSRGTGHNRFVKNYPTNTTFLFDSKFRWEQVWLDR